MKKSMGQKISIKIFSSDTKHVPRIYQLLRVKSKMSHLADMGVPWPHVSIID